jgi:hypothetical protein
VRLAPTSPSRDAAREPGEATVPVPLLAVVLLLFASSAFRLPRTFLDPAFWAEDCTILFRNSVEIGPRAILAPIYGSYHFLPRLAVFLVSSFPTYWAPVLYAVAAGLLSSLSLGLFSRAGFRWLVPDDRLRVFLCWLFSLAPGTSESYFALCTVNYAMFCGLVFLLLERDGEGRWQMGGRRALLVSFLWFSVGQGLVLAALLAYLFWLTRNRNYLLCLATLAGASLLNATSENVYRPASPPGPGRLALLYFENLALRLGFVSVVPRPWHDVVRQMESTPFVLSSVALIGSYLWVAIRARRRDAEGARVLVVAVLSAMALYPLTALARNYGVTALTRAHVTLGGRAGLVPAVLALLLLWQLLARPGRRGVWRIAAAGLLAWTTYCVLHERIYQPPPPPLSPAWEWPAQAATIDAALGARRAGTLQEAVVVRQIRCRPAWSPTWKIRRLTIAPDEGPIPSAPPPPRR